MTSPNSCEPQKTDSPRTCEVHNVPLVPPVTHGDLPRDPRTWTCPDCDQQAVQRHAAAIHEDFERRRIQDRQQVRQRELEARLGASGIPKRYQGYSFDSFPAEVPRAKLVADTLRSYANRWGRVMNSGTSVILVGGVGTGKTGLACSVANHVMREHGATAAFLSTYGAVRHLRDTWGRKGRTEREAFDDLVGVDLLVLDEVGATLGSDSEMAALFEIINGRYQDQRPMIMCSNLPMDDFETSAGRRDGLKTFLGQRIMSRYEDDQSFVLTCDWHSLRGRRA